MPLYTNTERGTVSYQPDDGFHKQIILANDFTNTTKQAHGTLGNVANIYTIGSAQFTDVTDFQFALGPNESVIGKYSFFVQAGPDEEFIYRFVTVDPSATTTTAVATNIKQIGLALASYNAVGPANETVVSLSSTDQNTVSTATNANNGIGAAIVNLTDDAQNDSNVQGEILIENFTNTAAKVKLQITVTSTGTEANLKLSRGSYIAYSKF